MTKTEREIKILREQGATYRAIAQLQTLPMHQCRQTCLDLGIERGEYEPNRRSLLRPKIEAFLKDGVLSQNKIAEQMNVSRQYVSQIKQEMES